MDLIEFLRSEKLISSSNLGRAIWPNDVHAAQRMSNKLNNVQNRKLTQKDKELIVAELHRLTERIKEIEI